MTLTQYYMRIILIHLLLLYYNCKLYVLTTFYLFINSNYHKTKIFIN